MRDLVDPPFGRGLREAAERMRDFVDPPFGRGLREAAERMRDLVDPPMMRGLREQQERIRDLGAGISFVRSTELLGRGAGLIESALRASHLEPEANLAALAAAGISNLAGRFSEPSYQPIEHLVSAGVAFLGSPFEDAPADLVGAVPPEFFRALDLDNALRVTDLELAKGEREALANHASDELRSALAGTDPGLVTLLEGARRAAVSDNPDRVRHVCISLRELLGHVLRLLAPDGAVTGWASDKSLFHDGKPTRRARLEYLHRGVGAQPLRDLIDADIRTAIELIDVLSQGSHVIDLGANTAAALPLLITRAEGTLLMLLRLEAHQTGSG